MLQYCDDGVVMATKLGADRLDRTVRFTFSIEAGKLREFKAWCKKNKVSAALILRMYVEKELAGR
jgi:hypothetical protein